MSTEPEHEVPLSDHIETLPADPFSDEVGADGAGEACTRNATCNMIVDQRAATTLQAPMPRLYTDRVSTATSLHLPASLISHHAEHSVRQGRASRDLLGNTRVRDVCLTIYHAVASPTTAGPSGKSKTTYDVAGWHDPICARHSSLGHRFCPHPSGVCIRAGRPAGLLQRYCTSTIYGQNRVVRYSDFDRVMIWRCYMVYNKKLWIAIVPGIVLLVNACAGYLVCYELSHATHGTTVFQTAASWITTFFSLTMAINVSCTAVIALRIYMSGSLSGSIHSLMPALIAIVESGALYSSGLMGLLIAYCRDSNGQYPALDVVQPLAGITFSLIVLQIHFRVGTPSVDKAVPLMPRYQWSSSGTRDAGSRVLAVQVSEETTVDFPTVGSTKKGSEGGRAV